MRAFKVGMAEIESVAGESSASTEQVSASTEETSASAEQIAASAHELATNAEQLIGHFQISQDGCAAPWQKSSRRHATPTKRGTTWCGARPRSAGGSPRRLTDSRSWCLASARSAGRDASIEPSA